MATEPKQPTVTPQTSIKKNELTRESPKTKK